MTEHEPQNNGFAEPEGNKEKDSKAEVSIEDLDDVTGGVHTSSPPAPPPPPPPDGGE